MAEKAETPDTDPRRTGPKLTNTSGTDRSPMCGNCGSTMSPRDGNRWFCTSCVEYGAYTGLIRADDPVHPMFTKWLKEAPERLVGFHVEWAGPMHGESGNRMQENFGEIVDVSHGIVECEYPGEGPVVTVTRELELDDLWELLDTPRGPDDISVPADEHIHLVK